MMVAPAVDGNNSTPKHSNIGGVVTDSVSEKKPLTIQTLQNLPYQLPPSPGDKKSVSFPANIVPDDRRQSDNSPTFTSPKVSPVRSYTEPTKRRPNSLSAITTQTLILPQRSSTTVVRGRKKDSAIQTEIDANVDVTGKKNNRLYRRNTYSDDLTRSRELDVEAQKWAENYRKRRHSKKKQKISDDDEYVIGTRIGEDHVNYVLMYNMLTGIRVGVSRCNAKLQRDLTDADFKAAHKLAFDITGNELTPSAKYDFKFKDYAPWVFRCLRECFHIDAADYLVSLTSKYILSELGSPGKSGSFFYFSRDYRFIIKTIHHTEHKFMRKILREYYEHVRKNPDTLLSRFYGLHRVKLPRGRKIHFVVMNNIFPPHRDIHEVYDLKGSTVGREYSEEEAKKNPRAVLKDLNWMSRHRHLELGPEKRNLFVEQLERDVKLLQRLNIMDYSLLVGLHDTARGNKDNIREDILTVFEPDTKKLERAPSNSKRESKVSALRKAVVRTDPLKLGPSSTKLALDSYTNRRRHCIFYTDDGGFAATDEQDHSMSDIYYLGVIDILTPYNVGKKVEHAWKSLSYDKNGISAVSPILYGKRFLDFMVKTIKANDEGGPPATAEDISPMNTGDIALTNLS